MKRALVIAGSPVYAWLLLMAGGFAFRVGLQQDVSVTPQAGRAASYAADPSIPIPSRLDSAAILAATSADNSPQASATSTPDILGDANLQPVAAPTSVATGKPAGGPPGNQPASGHGAGAQGSGKKAATPKPTPRH
jgi:hypothetical protein